MLSVRGIYENGKITIKKDPSQIIPPASKLIITFTDTVAAESTQFESSDESFLEEEINTENFSDQEEVDTFTEDISIPEDNNSPEQSEDYYESLREFERVPATGNITIIDGDQTNTYPLFDYSQGGLCFISDKNMSAGSYISAGITDPSNTDMVLMELEMEVRGVFKSEKGMKIGCMFLNPVDEDLWHGLLQFLS